MVKTAKQWLPDQPSLNVLLRLRLPVIGLVDEGHSDHPGHFVLRDSQGALLHLTAEYADVHFKFECLFIRLSPDDRLRIDGLTECFDVPHSSQVRLLVSSSWERAANIGELPAHFDQLIQESGKFADIPQGANTIGIYLLGIAFSSERDLSPSLCIVADQSRPGCMRSVREAAEIDCIVNAADMLYASELTEWVSSLRKKLTQLGFEVVDA